MSLGSWPSGCCRDRSSLEPQAGISGPYNGTILFVTRLSESLTPEPLPDAAQCKPRKTIAASYLRGCYHCTWGFDGPFMRVAPNGPGKAVFLRPFARGRRERKLTLWRRGRFDYTPAAKVDEPVPEPRGGLGMECI